MSINGPVKEEPPSPELPTSPSPPPPPTRSTMSKKAELIFPVARVDRMLRDGRYSKRYSSKAAVYLTSVLENLSSMVILKAGEATTNAGRSIIVPKDLLKGIKNDEPLNSLLSCQNHLQIADAIDVIKRRRSTKMSTNDPQ